MNIISKKYGNAGTFDELMDKLLIQYHNKIYGENAKLVKK